MYRFYLGKGILPSQIRELSAPEQAFLMAAFRLEIKEMIAEEQDAKRSVRR